jgi:hypothetical protein
MMMLGVVWRDHQPYLRLRDKEGTDATLVPVAGLKLNYRIEGEPKRTCLGHVPFRAKGRDYHDCHKPPQEGSRRCERCTIVEATFASNLHHAHTKGSAELDPSVQRHLEQPNRLYLAAFRDGSIKVGTSTLNRSQRRLEEQGAWLARFVAETTNGKLVRHIEDAVTEDLGLPQSVSAMRKLRGLVKPVDDDELLARLADFADNVETHVLARELDPTVMSLAEPWRHPMADHPALVGAIEYPLRVLRGSHDLELITAVGRHLVAQRPGGTDAFVLDPQPLFGVWPEIGDFGSDEIAIQDSLF